MAWSELPISAGDELTAAQFNELEYAARERMGTVSSVSPTDHSISAGQEWSASVFNTAIPDKMPYGGEGQNWYQSDWSTAETFNESEVLAGDELEKAVIDDIKEDADKMIRYKFELESSVGLSGWYYNRALVYPYPLDSDWDVVKASLFGDFNEPSQNEDDYVGQKVSAWPDSWVGGEPDEYTGGANMSYGLSGSFANTAGYAYAWGNASTTAVLVLKVRCGWYPDSPITTQDDLPIEILDHSDGDAVLGSGTLTNHDDSVWREEEFSIGVPSTDPKVSLVVSASEADEPGWGLPEYNEEEGTWVIRWNNSFDVYKDETGAILKMTFAFDKAA